MTTTTFDTLTYATKLEEAGVPRQQAKVQADTMRDFVVAQDESLRKELATKGDLREIELRLQAEIEKVRAEVQKTKYDLLKWQLGIGLAIIIVIAKGFGWLGF